MSGSKCKAVIFDLDGVITGTAAVHSTAWAKVFDSFMKELSDKNGTVFSPFSAEDYEKYVDGMPRAKGVQTFLASRGIVLPLGNEDDSPDKNTVWGLGNRKNEVFQGILMKEGADIFQSSVDFIKALKKQGIRCAVASSSKNCELILKMAGLSDLFEVRVDGMVSSEIGLKGKPEPDIFVVAAERMGLLPSQCVVVEDAISGVQAGNAGNFGMTLGVARNKNGQDLLKGRADIVVEDLSEISIETIKSWFENEMENEGWLLTYNFFEPEKEKLREVLCAVGNGYFCVRGAMEGSKADNIHYPGTYLAGLFNKIPTSIHGRDIYNNDFVCCPNWLHILFKINHGQFIDPLKEKILDYEQQLNMKDGILLRQLTIQDGLGRITRIASQLFVSMDNPRLGAMLYEITPCNYSGFITLRSGIDGNIINDNVARYRSLNQKHLEGLGAGQENDHIFLKMRTSASHYEVFMRVRTTISSFYHEVNAEENFFRDSFLVAKDYTFEVKEGLCYKIEKTLAIASSLDKENDTPETATYELISECEDFYSLAATSRACWAKIWDKCDIVIEGDRLSQMALRMHIYHLVVSASPLTIGRDVSVGARGLHGEAYRGHVFWDELYFMPFYIFHMPELAKSLLMYRYRRLNGAREYAKANGYSGAMYPWQTADGGEEETQEVHYNPANDSWGPDLSRRQRHVSIAIFFNFWKYYNITRDTDFIHEIGAELMIEIARFWNSIAKEDDNGKLSIEGIMGPDEFHEALPGQKNNPGLKDNAYTNIMTSWLLHEAVSLAENLPIHILDNLKEKIGFDIKECERWIKVADNLNLVLKDGILSQFDGYFDLDELDWDFYRKKYGDIHRMDRILKAENDSPDHYRLAKQPDALMAFYILLPEQVSDIIKNLGYNIEDPVSFLKANYEYYKPRTSHGSTLSKIVHAIISSYIGAGDVAWEWFMEALISDLEDTQGGTSHEGIHAGVMAGTIDMVYRYFAGINPKEDYLSVTPNLPKHWTKLSFKMRYVLSWYQFYFNDKTLRVRQDSDMEHSEQIEVMGKKYNLPHGNFVEITL